MNLKCECYIHSLKQGEKNVLWRSNHPQTPWGDNDYLAEVSGRKMPMRSSTTPFVGRYFVDDV